MLARARSGKKRSAAKAILMDDEVQAILDRAIKALKSKGYTYRLEVTYQKDGIKGSILCVPMPKRDGQ